MKLPLTITIIGFAVLTLFSISAGAFVLMPGYDKDPAGTVYGYIKLSSSPSEAPVYIDGIYVENTPVEIRVPVGFHTVSLQKSGFGVWMRSVEVIKNKTESISASLNSDVFSGYLSVSSNVGNAKVFVSDIYRGTTPMTLSLPSGKYTIRVDADGYVPYSATVYVEALTTTQHSVLLEKTTGAGYLKIKSIPVGADVYLDGTYLGVTSESSYVTAGPLSDGSTHILTLSKDGCDTSISTISVTSSETKYMTVTLIEKSVMNGYISVASSPSGASVFVDNQYYGASPVSNIAVPAGSHVLRVASDGYAELVETVTVSAGQLLDKSVTLAQQSNEAKSPAPFAGILAGCICACLLFRRR